MLTRVTSQACRGSPARSSSLSIVEAYGSAPEGIDLDQRTHPIRRILRSCGHPLLSVSHSFSGRFLEPDARASTVQPLGWLEFPYQSRAVPIERFSLYALSFGFLIFGTTMTVTQLRRLLVLPVLHEIVDHDGIGQR